MFKLVEGQISREASHFRNALDDHQRNMVTYGFPYLNSHYNDDMLYEIDRLRRSILEQIQDSNLKEIDRRMTEIHHERELKMIRTIYDYAEAHPFETGVFYIGAAHRRGILVLIEKFEQQEETKICWVISHD
jgi:hypothetical protein